MTLDTRTDQRYRYPNMAEYDDTRGGKEAWKWNAWSEGNPPSHHVMLPFTRLLSGPMDYTPGTFDILFLKTRRILRADKVERSG